MTPTSNEIRKQFIDFFVQRHGHTFVPSMSVVPPDDPTLMFANAGMNQFKDVFLGTGARRYGRAVNSQKCIRVSGKHNDLEEVGVDTYHHTFFEMLGNWSFGDYYKPEAIRWAWELLTDVWGLDKSRLHVTVFEGDPEDGLEPDEEARRLWLELTDINPSHIHLGSKADNFWAMGDTGPCGPCSEISYDRTPDKSGGRLVNAGDPAVIEVWNLVFIQYNRDETGKLQLLPAQHVDTGMGFERMVAVLQGKSSNYDTDVFTPIMDAIGTVTGRSYGAQLEDPSDIAIRVIADHLRMLTFAITDGALPDNKGRGSVVRSVLRRAVRFGWQVFGIREPFIFRLVPALVAHLGAAYPELKGNQDRVAAIIRGEEADFLRTIERGLGLFEEAAERARAAGGQISGKDLFDLHTTFGFPPDLTRQMARERHLSVDDSAYERLFHEHEEKSRGQGTVQQVALNVGGLPLTDDHLRWFTPVSQGMVLGWITGSEFVSAGRLQAGSEAGLVLDETCFYAEAGGQVGDRGAIKTLTGSFQVNQTVRVGSAVVHLGQVTTGWVEPGQQADLEVDPARELTRKNHTATHLLHWALRQVLGEHVEQRGSRVKPEEFTFDFVHSGPLTEEERREVEALVNERVYQDLPVQWRELPIADAQQLPGVRAFFGDKYGDVVRVVEIADGFSREFCGGTHLDHTGQIGFFKMVGEEAVARGVRRITGVTGPAAVQTVQRMDAALTQLSRRFNCRPEEVETRVDGLQEEVRRLQQQIRKGAAGGLTSAADRLLAEARAVDGAKVITGELPGGPAEQVREQIDRLRQKAGSAVIVVGWTEEDRAQLIAAVTDDLVARGMHAGKLVGEVAKLVGGSGGGRPTLAQAGGKEPGRLAEAMARARDLAEEQLSA